MSRAEATKARILQAATAEFAAHGIAGARVDRIAAAAKANKNLIYVYFENKLRLFDAVFDAEVATGLERVPFTVEDLPGYAVRLFDYYREHPDVLRLATWRRLEIGDAGTEPADAGEVHAAKLAAIADAQAGRRISARIPPAALLTIILGIASAWAPVGTGAVPHGAASGQDPEASRAAIIEAVRALIA
ncbi:TetR family transcriptional regulator [Phytomonospora sp. NPDC050363]|uniref:TetR family transcriptional regulator n=1 Tax=Phytomonospora sp. NPDC050363 TaxID=3155642 RepID=UPI003400CFC0